MENTQTLVLIVGVAGAAMGLASRAVDLAIQAIKRRNGAHSHNPDMIMSLHTITHDIDRRLIGFAAKIEEQMAAHSNATKELAYEIRRLANVIEHGWHHDV